MQSKKSFYCEWGDKSFTVSSTRDLYDHFLFSHCICPTLGCFLLPMRLHSSLNRTESPAPQKKKNCCNTENSETQRRENCAHKHLQCNTVMGLMYQIVKTSAKLFRNTINTYSCDYLDFCMNSSYNVI